MADEDQDQLYCFLDDKRLCNGSCVAYQGIVKEENPYLDGAQQHCVLLRSSEQTGRGAVVLAGVIRKDIIDRKNQAADAQRAAGMPKPPVPGAT